MFLHPRKIGKTKSVSWLMLFRVLGKCMHHCNPGQFIDVDAAVEYTFEQTILTNYMFFGGEKNSCDKRTCDLAWYNDLVQLTDPLGQIFHEKLCAKITADGGDYHVIFLGEHAWEGCRDWFYDDKILNLCSIAHGSFTMTMPGNEIASWAHWMLVLHFFQGRQWNGRECLFPLEGLHAWWRPCLCKCALHILLLH